MVHNVFVLSRLSKRIACNRFSNSIVSIATGIALLFFWLPDWNCEAAPPQKPDKIVVATDDNYPPFIFRDEEGKLNGILIDEWNLWSKKTGIKVEWIATDWNKAQSLMLEGKADVLETVFFTEERAKKLTFSKPYVQIRVPVYFHRSLSGISDFKTLRGFAIGAKAGDASIEVLRKNGINTIVEYPSYEAIINDASAGNLKVFTIDEPPALYLLYKKNLDREFRQSLNLYTGAFHRAVLKGREDILSLVEEGFGKITDSERKAVENPWLGEPLINPRYYQIALVILISVVAIILTLVIFSLILRNQVQKKTSELEKAFSDLRRSEEQYRTAVQATKDGLFEIDFPEGAVSVSPGFYEIFSLSTKHDLLRMDEWLGFFSEPARKEIMTVLEKCFNGDDSFHTELSIEGLSGENRWILMRGKVVERSDSGKIIRIAGAFTDIDVLKKTEEQLRKAEARWKFAIEGTEQGLWDYDLSTGKIFFSRQWKTMLGYEEDEIGNTLSEWEKRVHPDDLDKALKDVERHLKGETEMYLNEHRLQCKDGSYKWILDRGKVIEYDSSGNPVRMIGTHTDISERIEKERLLQEKEAIYRFLFEHNPAPMLIYEKGTLQMLAVNEAFVRNYGYQPDEISGMRLTDLYPEEEKEPMQKLAERLKGYAFAGEWHHRKKDGTLITILAHSHDLLFEGRSARVAVITDITYLKKIEQELTNARVRAEESDRLKTAFLANMSHEIRTPMNGIIGFCELINDPEITPSKQREYISIIRNSSYRLLGIINDIIDISKIEAGQVVIRKEKVELVALLEEAVRFFENEAKKKNLVLRSNYSPLTKKLFVVADRTKLYQVISNLLKNAIKFTTEGSIEAGFEEKNNEIVVFVKDTGIGIDREDRERIFERFRQGENIRINNYEGAGLGLSISKAFVEMMDGRIWVESEKGKGTTFYFTLPKFES